HPDTPVLLGVPTRGAPLAYRLAERVTEFSRTGVGAGTLDVTLHRDDLRSRPTKPLAQTALPRSGIDSTTVILVDDVLFSGRTMRAGLVGLLDHVRSRSVQLAALVDRVDRALPNRADYVGKNTLISPIEDVKVLLSEVDGRDAVLLRRVRGRANDDAGLGGGA